MAGNFCSRFWRRNKIAGTRLRLGHRNTLQSMGNLGARSSTVVISVSASDYGMSFLVSRFDAIKSFYAIAERRKLLPTGGTFRSCGEDLQSALPKTPLLLITNPQTNDCAATTFGHSDPAYCNWSFSWHHAHAKICALSLSVFWPDKVSVTTPPCEANLVVVL